MLVGDDDVNAPPDEGCDAEQDEDDRCEGEYAGAATAGFLVFEDALRGENYLTGALCEGAGSVCFVSTEAGNDFIRASFCIGGQTVSAGMSELESAKSGRKEASPR